MAKKEIKKEEKKEVKPLNSEVEERNVITSGDETIIK